MQNLAQKLTMSAALAIALSLPMGLMGCGNNSESTPSAATPTARPHAAAEHATTEHATMHGATVPEAAAQQAAAMTQQASHDASSATTAATSQPASLSEAATAQADELIQQATTYIKENKLDMADQAVAKLKELKPKLPASYGPRIDQLAQSVEALKNGASKLNLGGINLGGNK